MLLNTLEKLQGITDVTPHAYPQNPFPIDSISQETKDKLVSFTLDICQEVEIMSKNGANPKVEDFAQYTERFKQIREQMKEEAKKRTPEEYVECAYVIAYQFIKLLGKSQKFVSNVLGFKESNYKSYWGTSPNADLVAFNSKYQFKLPFETESDFLEVIIPYIGKKAAIVSNDYTIGVSNCISIFANIPQTNKNSNRGKGDNKFYGRQFFHTPKEFDDYYFSFFIEHTRTNPQKFKEIASNILDTSDIEVSDALMEYLINVGYKFEKSNLNNNNFTEFTLDYEKYQNKYKERAYFIESKDDPEHDFDDMFSVEKEEYLKGVRKDKVAICEENIERLNRELGTLCDKLMKSIDMSSFITKDNIGVLKFVINQYQEELNNFKPEYFEEKDNFCAKYFVTKYFESNGVSEISVENFKQYLESSDYAKYIDKYENDYLGVLQNGVDINSNRSFTEILTELKNEMIRKDSKKDDKKEPSRNCSNALIYIDASCYNVTDELMTSLREIYDKFYFIVSSEVKLSLGGMQEEYLRTDYRELYLYTNI